MQDVIARLGRGRKIFSRREHAAAQEFFAAAVTDLLGPVHPVGFAQSEKMPRRFIGRDSQVVEAKQHHARSPVRPLERRFSGQSEISYPFVQSCAVVVPPQELPRSANAAIGAKCWPGGNASASPDRPASATSRIAARSASRRRARRAAFAAQSARVPFRKFFASSLRLPSRCVFAPRQETLLWSRAVRRRAPHLRHRPESTPYGPDPRNPPRKHCKRALLLSRRRHFSRTLRRASRTEQQSAAPAARVFHSFPQRITLSLFLTLFPKC